MFRSSVREFAGAKSARAPRGSTRKPPRPRSYTPLFDLRNENRVALVGPLFFTAIVAVQRVSRVDASVGVFLDIQKHARQQRLDPLKTRAEEEVPDARLATKSLTRCF
jgi:hypothetical protein